MCGMHDCACVADTWQWKGSCCVKCFSDLLISVLFLREPVRLACEWFPDTSLHWVTLNMQPRLREERERMGEGGGGRSREPEREAGNTLLTLQGLALGALGYGVGAPAAGELVQRTNWDGAQHGGGGHSGGQGVTSILQRALLRSRRHSLWGGHCQTGCGRECSVLHPLRQSGSCYLVLPHVAKSTRWQCATRLVGIYSSTRGCCEWLSLRWCHLTP